MIEKEIHQVLLGADEYLPQDEYLPSHFDYQAAMAEVKSLAAELSVLGYETQLDNQVQDATFFASLSCSKQAFIMRFSGSGRLVLVTTSNIISHKSDGLPTDVLELLQKRKYQIIRAEQIADAPYDGTTNHFAGKFTWFQRYFDYL